MTAPRPPRDLAVRRRAVVETGTNVVVSAGAGTGKTSLIVERLLVTLGGGLASFRSIAAITFTEKAAGELRFRLAAGLEELARRAESGEAADSPAGRALAHLLAAAGAERGEIARRASDAARRLDRATVTTIHGFCTEILRSHPIEAALPPGFQVDRGPASLRIAREEWAAFLEEELGERAGREDLWRSALAALTASELEKLGRGLSRGAIPGRVLAEPYRPIDFAATLGAAAARLAADLAAARDTKGLTPAPLAWIDEAVGVLEAAARGRVDDARRLLEDAERLGGPLKARTTKVSLDDSRRVEALGRSALDLIRSLTGLDEGALSSAIEAVLPYSRRLRERLHRQGLVDFDTLLVAARDLLRDHRDVRDALKTRFSTLLLDEFQDTDPLQYEIVFYLAEREGEHASDAWAARLAPGRLFIVGDAKQSIYRFRGADFGAYRRAVARVLEQGGVELTLSANFRSRPGILGPVNAIGRAWVPSEDLPPYEPIEAERPEAPPPAVEIWTTPAGAAAADERRRAEGRAIAAEIRRLAAQGTAYGDVLILLRSFSHVPAYLRELRQAGIPFVASGARTFYERAEIVQALGVLRAVVDPSDPIARLAFLRSPAGAVPDAELLREVGGGAHPVATPTLWEAERRLAALRAEVATLPVDVAVRHVLERSGLLAVNALGFEGAQRVANLEKLAADASEFARDGRLTALELVDALEDRPRGEEEGDSPLADESTDAVRVMTVHRAKGLEAPVVILADASAGRRTPPDRAWRIGILRHEGDERIAVEGPTLNNAAAALAKLGRRAQEEAEDRRLLYVALTRAQERLVVLAGKPSGPSPWMQALEAWGYDATLPPSDGTPLHGGAVILRSIDPSPAPAPVATGVPEGAPEAVERYAVAMRAPTSGAETRSPSLATIATEPGARSDARAAFARAVGRSVHARLARLTEGSPPPEAVVSETRAILSRFEESPLAARLASMEIVGREVPMLLRDDAGVLWRGGIDLLGRDADGTLVVVDFKTDAELEGAADRHREQLAVYLAAVRRAVPGGRARAEVWMVRHGEVVPVDVP